jgi:alpha-L-rhamnosidase
LDRLVELIHEADDRVGTGFLSSGALLPILAENGRADLAFRLLFRRGTPSWLGMLDRGATTIWEDWEGVEEDGTAHASLNHYSKGAVIRFLHEYLVGLRQAPGSVGWERFEVKPFPGGDVTSASFRFVSPRGEIEVSWWIVDDEFHLDVTVPPGSEAAVALPDGTTAAYGPGLHRARCLHASETVTGKLPVSP